MLANDIASLMSMIPNEDMQARQEGTDHLAGGVFKDIMDKSTPFMFKGGEGVNAGRDDTEWVVNKDKQKYSGAYLYIFNIQYFRK